MLRALQTELPRHFSFSPGCPRCSRIPAGCGQGRAAGLRPALPLAPVSSQAASGLQAHLHLPLRLCRKPDEPFSFRQNSSLSQNSRFPLCPSGRAASPRLSPRPLPHFSSPCPTSLTSPPGQAGPLSGRVAPSLALGLPSRHRSCVGHASPGRGLSPLPWGGWIPVQKPDLPSQGLLGHPHIAVSPEMGRGDQGQGARRGWVGSGGPKGFFSVPKGLPETPGPAWRGTERAPEAQAQLQHRKAACPQGNNPKCVSGGSPSSKAAGQARIAVSYLADPENLQKTSSPLLFLSSRAATCWHKSLSACPTCEVTKEESKADTGTAWRFGAGWDFCR